MKTKITVIVDNIKNEFAEGEWGLCLFVEYGEKKILVDAGSSKLFLENMKKLGKDVKDVDLGVLSHAHYDHANGIPAFFENNEKASFYIRETTSNDLYHKKFIFRYYIGIPKHMLRDHAGRIVICSGDYKIDEGIYLIPHKTAGLDEIGKRESMYRRTKKGLVPDDFSHEQSLVLDTDKGLVIINSCSHGGAANIINEIKETFPDKHIHAIIGGFHLFNKSEEEIREVAKRIKDTGIDHVCTGHCTKNRAFGILKEELGDKIDMMKVGFEMEF